MSNKKKLSIVRNTLLFTVIVWFLVAFLIVPVVGVLKTTFFADGSFSTDAIHKLISSPRVRKSLTNTYVMAFCSIITVSIVGIFQILVTEYFDIKGSKIMELAFMTPLVYGGVSLVRGYKYVYSSRGILTQFLENIIPNFNENWFTGFMGVLFVHTFAMTTYHILFVKTAFKNIDYSTIEAAKSLGASNMKAFFQVALPVVKPALFSATILLALGALNSFAAPSMLGGKDFYMINSMVLTLNGMGSYELSALLSLILGLTCIILLLVMNYMEKKSSYISVSKVPTKMRKVKIHNPVLNVIIHLVSYLLTIIYLAPVICIVIFSFGDTHSIITGKFPTSFTLSNYVRVLTSKELLKPFINSIKLSFIAVIIVMIIAVASSFAIKKHPGKATKLLEMTLLIPWILPATMLVVGMITTYSTPNWLVFGQVLVGGFWILPIAYSVCNIPSSMRLVRASLFSINDSLEEAGHALGGGAFYVLRRVVVPIIFPTVISTAAITFNGLLSEYTISALLYNVNNIPLGIMLRSPELSTDPNSEANTLIYIVILMVISAITLAATQKYRDNK